MTEQKRPLPPSLLQIGHNFFGAQAILLFRIFALGEAPRNPWTEQ